MAEKAALGIDIGGTKIAVGIVTADGKVGNRVRTATPEDPEEVLRVVVESVDQLGEEADGLPVGVGAAGLVAGDGRVAFAPNLAWRDHPLRAELETRLERPVHVENDANASAWAEHRVGVANDLSSVLLLAVGTGIGGGLVIDGRLIRGANGYAAEFGHIVVNEGGRECPCGNRGCLEAMASGDALGATVTEWRREGRIPEDSILSLFPETTGVHVGRAAQAGDETAAAAVAECGRWLGVGIASLVNALDPEIVVIGGGVASLGGHLLLPARQAFAERAIGAAYREVPQVVFTALEKHSTLVGAGLLALEATLPTG